MTKRNIIKVHSVVAGWNNVDNIKLIFLNQVRQLIIYHSNPFLYPVSRSRISAMFVV